MLNLTEKYVLLTGSDLGDKTGQLNQALEHIRLQVGKVIATSNIIESAPWGFRSKTTFLNQAILIETNFTPETLLDQILNIENLMGRQRNGTQWSSRTIDIDILCAESTTFSSDRLTIPHRFLHNRAFALTPLCQLAPNWLHPTMHQSYRQLLNELELSLIENPVHNR